jgi:tetrahydromethanopterin S-methyltransferase subunit F
MACLAMTNLYAKGNMNDQDYETFIRNQSALDGQLCAVSNYGTVCANQCSTMSLNYSGCFSCLANPNSCGQLTDGKPLSCCPNIEAATTCNNCMGLYTVDALSNCLKTGLSTAAIIGIVVGVIVFLIIVGVIIYVVIKARRETQAKYKLQKGGFDVGNNESVDYNKALEGL